MKKKLLHSIVTPVFALSMLGLAACGSDDDSDSSNNEQAEPASVTPKVTIGFKASADNEPEFVIAQESVLSGTVSAQGAGLEQIGWNFFYPVGSTLFVSGYENYESRSYIQNDDGDLEQLATFFYDWPIEVFGNVNDEILLASDTPRDGTHTTRKLYVVSAETGLITQKLDYTIHDVDTGTPGEGTVGWPLGLVVRGDHLFVPFQKLDDQGWYTTPEPDMATVAVYDYPLVADEMSGVVEPSKIIQDSRTAMIGVNGVTTGLIQADNGDLYSFSNGTRSAGFSPASTKPSAILRIKNGETVFDGDYFFDISAATNGGTLFWFDYAGNNKAIGRILINEDECLADEAAGVENASCTWAAFGKSYFNHKLVIIDLENQTVTDVANVPLHAKRYTSALQSFDGKYYVSVETADGAHVYEIDVEMATGTQGAEILGKTVKGFYNLN